MKKLSTALDKNLLIVSYYFPPLGMGGVQRVVSLTSHLSQLGWNVSVLTVKPSVYPAHDNSLLDKVPKLVGIFRAAPFGAEKLKNLFSRNDAKSGAELTYAGSELARWAMLPDSKIVSLPNVLRMLPEVLKQSRPAVVLTSSPPPSIHLVGLHIKKHHGIKWVADFRDIWFPQSTIDFRTALHRKLQRHLESTYFRNADAAVVVTDDHLRLLRTKYDGIDSKVRHIPNGFDETDYKSALPIVEWKTLRIGYSGTLNRLTYVRGLFEILCDLAKERPLTVDIFGVVTASVTNDIRRIDPDQSVIKLHGYRNHSEAIEFGRSCNVNLITLAPDSHLEATIPGKTYEVLRIEKPVIAVIPRESAAWKLLTSFNDVLIVDASNVSASRNDIITLIDRASGDIGVRPGIDEFEWHNLAKRYDALLREVTA
ncbi:MAG: glycosyltransferase [Candidatus Zixiibacteriota bacterium]